MLDKLNVNFDKLTLQGKEEIILDVMFEANTLIGNTKNKKEIENLFESVSGIHYNPKLINTNMYAQYFGNKYAYIKDVTNLMENHIPHHSSLYSDINFIDNNNTFKEYLQTLARNNDFDKYFDSDILKHKIFAKTPLTVYGFNVFDVEKIKEHLNDKTLFAVVFDRLTKSLIFVASKQIVKYDIQNNSFMNKSIESNINNFKNNLSGLIGDEFVCLYEPKPNIKYTDNVYLDKTRHDFLESMRKKQNTHKLFKDF